MAPRSASKRRVRGGGSATDYRGCVTFSSICLITLVASIASYYLANADVQPVMQQQRRSVPTKAVVPAPPERAMHNLDQPIGDPVAVPEVVAVKETTQATSTSAATMAFALEKCRVVAFLRIQKTASTTFGQEIMAQMCGRHHQVCLQPWDHCNFGRKKCSMEFYNYHLDYKNVKQFTMGNGRGCIVTILRDPIERLMSEYFMLKLKHRQFLSFDQWDVHQDDLLEIDAILSINSINESFWKYLHHPRNPSRNRQTLYLLGFQRVACNSTRCGGNACICNASQPGYPAITYDWDNDGTGLLESAKAHLRSLDAFGLVECFNESIQVIAPTLAWDVKAAMDLAQKQALHVWKPVMEKAREIHPLVGPGAPRRLSFNGPGHNWWREFLHEDVRKEIVKVNRLDVELVNFARDEFRSKYGMKCQEMP